MVSEPIPTQTTMNITSLIPTSIPSAIESFHVPSPPSSPTTTSTSPSTPITISPCSTVYVGFAQPQISITQSTPLYTDSTIKTTTTTSTPPVTVNLSDTKTGASSVTLVPAFSPISPLRHDDPDTLSGDERDDFQDFQYSPSVFNKKVMKKMFL